MKKSLIALAALAAVGAASAQSSVTLYGVVDAGYSWARDTRIFFGTKNERTRTGFTSGNLSGSRWGLKGQEDLGNGLAAVFNVEAGFDSINGDFTDGFNRRSVVGLKGAFGQVLVGRDDTPIHGLASGKYQAIDSFSYDNLGGYYVPGPALYTDRYNGIHYTGEFSGVSVKAFAGYDEYKREVNGVLVPGSKVKGHGVGLGLGYASGAFSIDGAVQHFDQGLLGGNKNTEFAVAASYDFGPAKLMGHYIGNKIQDFPTFQQFGLGVTAPFGAATLGAQYAYNRGKDGTGGPKVDGSDFGVIANYALSKRTDLYARAMRSNSWKVLNEKYYSDSVTVGIRHSF